METPFSFSVRTKGLEPPRLTALDPKSSAATNYATPAAKSGANIHFFRNANFRSAKSLTARIPKCYYL